MFCVSSALAYAASQGHLECMRLLLQHGADVCTHNAIGVSPLHRAAGSGRLQAVELLFTAKADPTATDSEGCTPLHAACVKGHSAVTSYLLNHVADVDPRNARGCTPVHAAAVAGSQSCISSLFAHRADLKMVDATGKGALVKAALHGPAFVEFLATKIREQGESSFAEVRARAMADQLVAEEAREKEALRSATESPAGKARRKKKSAGAVSSCGGGDGGGDGRSSRDSIGNESARNAAAGADEIEPVSAETLANSADASAATLEASQATLGPDGDVSHAADATAELSIEAPMEAPAEAQPELRSEAPVEGPAAIPADAALHFELRCLRGDTDALASLDSAALSALELQMVESLRVISALRARRREEEAACERRRRDEDEARRLCVICFVGDRAVTFTPCGHCVTCTGCAELVADGRCPSCRAPIEQRIRTFLS